jgi:hypothetical protein
MKVKTQAMLNVARVLILAIAVVVIISLGVMWLGLAAVGTLLAVVVFAGLIKLGYDIELDSLERKQDLQLRRHKDIE